MEKSVRKRQKIQKSLKAARKELVKLLMHCLLMPLILALASYHHPFDQVSFEEVTGWLLFAIRRYISIRTAWIRAVGSLR
jgi:hypothetical protein